MLALFGVCIQLTGIRRQTNSHQNYCRNNNFHCIYWKHFCSLKKVLRITEWWQKLLTFWWHSLECQHKCILFIKQHELNRLLC